MRDIQPQKIDELDDIGQVDGLLNMEEMSPHL